MTQHGFSIANQTFPSFRSDLNTAIQALATLSSGGTAPATTYAYQLWLDTGNNLLKIRNGGNSNWITLGVADQPGLWMMTRSGSPQGAVAGHFQGQLCYDTTNNRLYVCTTTGTTSSTVWDTAPTQNGILAMEGLEPGFDATTPATKATIQPGSCVSGDGKFLIGVTSAKTVDIATSGANGLDTGTKANSTWYYLWIIGKTDGSGTTAGLFSLSSSNPTMPSGYTAKRLLPVAYRTDSSGNFIGWHLGSGWPLRPSYQYTTASSRTTNGTSWTTGVTNVLNGGTATSWTGVALSGVVPPLSKLVRLYMVNSASSATGYFSFRATGDSGNGRQWLSPATGTGMLDTPTNTSQSIDYQRDFNSASLILDVDGYTITEV